jgi:uncharacterized coiled-coil DUF342 family protein
MTKHTEILRLWGEINKRHKQIEDYQLKIGRLKDEILLLQQDIVEIQDEVDSSESGTYVPGGQME